MKKILIVNNNLDVGGIQKSLINLLKEIHDKYHITLLLFSKSGSLLKDVPKDVNVITPRKAYKILGLSKKELKRYPFLFILKAFLMKFASLFSRRSAMKILGLFQKKIKGYDVVISYSHLFNHKYFANGSGDFVLDKTICQNKVCLIHCDYLNSGCMSNKNNKEYEEFDKIACCSDSVKERFLEGTKLKSDNVYTLRNFYDVDIVRSANEQSHIYDAHSINLLTVARLSSEKGIDRAIDALFAVKREDIKYYVVGDGPQKELLQQKIKQYHMEKQVFLLGEQSNPYKYMTNADYLLVPSLNEAAPIVFDEANVLGLKVISTDTTSAVEMVGDKGIICNNSLDGIKEVLSSLTKSFKETNFVKTNQLQYQQLSKILSNETL